MEVRIDGIDFWNAEAMKYYSFPKKFSQSEKKEKAKYMCLSGDYWGAIKVDGAWAMLIRDNNGIFHLRSRAPSVNGGYADKAEWIPQITSELQYIPYGTALLGEIYLPNDEGSNKITSILNCLKDKSLERQKRKPLHFYVFDMLAYNGKSLVNSPFIQRVNQKVIRTGTYCSEATYYSGEELWNLYGEIIAAGREGIVITRSDYHYQFGKKTAWKTLKLKKELQDTIDAYITGRYRAPKADFTGKTSLEEWDYWLNTKTGETYCENQFSLYLAGAPVVPTTKAYANRWAGAIEFALKKDNEEYSIGYISGISDQLKAEIISNPDKWIGKVAELSAMEIQDVENCGHYTLRHGRIERFRDDKQPEDCLFSQIL